MPLAKQSVISTVVGLSIRRTVSKTQRWDSFKYKATLSQTEEKKEEKTQTVKSDISREIKYLDTTLSENLNWNLHLTNCKTTERLEMLIWTC